jgi:hypothetical protein
MTFAMEVRSEDNSYQSKIDQFFLLYSESPIEAVDSLFSDSEWAINNQSQLQNVKAQISTLEQSIGKYHGYDEIVTRKLHDRYVIKIYMARYELKPIFFKFQFYRPDSSWNVSNFGLQDSIEELSENSAKYGIYREIRKSSGVEDKN